MKGLELMDVNEFDLKANKLRLLKEHGIISEEEFLEMRKKLIDDITEGKKI